MVFKAPQPGSSLDSRAHTPVRNELPRGTGTALGLSCLCGGICDRWQSSGSKLFFICDFAFSERIVSGFIFLPGEIGAASGRAECLPQGGLPALTSFAASQEL